MPQLGESVTEGTIGRWLVQPGQAVRRYQPLAEVITDKVNAELPAPEDGTILTLDAPEGATVPVGTLIATMAAAEDEAKGVATPSVPASDPSAETQARDHAGAAPGRYSPAVLRLAQEHGLDLSQIRGTGLGGRITRKDVEAAAQAQRQKGAAHAPHQQAVSHSSHQQAVSHSPHQEDTPQAQRLEGTLQSKRQEAATTSHDGTASTGTYAATQGPSPAPLPAPDAGDQVISVDPVRRRIAEKMVRSRREAPHAWSMVPVDVTNLVKLRSQWAEEFRRREGVPLSYAAFFIKAVAEALKEHPILNSQWAGEQIILKREINISVAVATESALAVPVIKGADRLSIAGLSYAVADVAARARAGKLTLEDITGGTFTVNNTGAFGSILSQPIINHPQAAILSFEAITKTPVVLEGDAIAIRSVMNICLSIDHRILDGLAAGRFLQTVRARLEAMGPERTSLY